MDITYKRFKDSRVSLATAKLLKLKGFANGTNGSYTEYLKTKKSDNPSFAMTKGEVETDSDFMINNHPECDMSNTTWVQYEMPTLSLVSEWLRVNFNIYVKSEPTDFINDPAKTYFAAMWFRHEWFKKEDFEDYDEAWEYAINQALNLI